ncbi:hypothetical protein G5T42_12745 [Microbacterium sp. 4R-513]|uniref:DUF6264 family protein n=1 Tax=Microbacterium sp. 4R-513 TaxID=2567934 RepID=UPI0013E1B894|nr:DUF6264 family protein [Microbacterium sp. 4R-513]QIG40239.1 hypothetical protein G5T42_12745 [Microbacterium sp. 4R-513]
MTNATPAQPERPRPEYGEYATPEEQRARIQQPDATWALDTGQALEPGQAPEAAPQQAAAPQRWPVDTSAEAARSGRNIDRVVTLSLLIVGAFNVVFTAISYFNLPALADQAMQIIGIPGSFTNVEAARLWGPIAAIVLIVGFLATALFAWRRLSKGKLAWWIPVVGAVITYLLVYVCLAVPLLGDPAFVEYATNPR